MANLPDPSIHLDGADKAAFDHMAAVRSHAEGRKHQAEVYLRMFNNPSVAERVGALGEQIRFHGTLPGDVREMAILRYSSRIGAGYEWAHHQRPANLEGITDATIAAITAGDIPANLAAPQQAVLRAVDAVVARKSIPKGDQDVIVENFGVSGVVEIVVICGLYAIMDYMCAAFDIPLEPGLPNPPF